MLTLLRRFLVVLIALVVIGPGVQPARAARQIHAAIPAAMLCDMAPAAMAAMNTPHKARPASPITDCAGHACCVMVVVLPDRPAAGPAAALVDGVRYWSARASLAGVQRAPEPLPPRTA